ncbi:peroxin 11C [Hirsutella rhossiliensis]|uniref:Peroxin 11C n=1 Tax=Hirsutella rhossiliensis TaxID=111463 RepID=A0A9P8MM75_9HYPO|nr:peroxin 11C [Hirsutella rhossiliensis]KAH0957594.1 peroxin 11C [Hirsutella rhossiliensis]
MPPQSDEPPVAPMPSGSILDPSPSPAKGPPSVAAVVAAAPSRADAFLAHLQRCLQTRAGADVVLLFLCYASRLGGSLLETLSRPILRLSARRLVAAAFKLPPATTVIMSATTPHPPLAALGLRLGGRFKALSAMLSETRTVGRLWGLLGLYFAAKRLVLKSCASSRQSDEKAPDDADGIFDAVVAYAQVISLVVFQAAENVAYLSSKKILPFPPATQGRLALISVRSWGLYIGMELGRLLVERSRKASSGAGTKDAAWAADWTKSFTRNLAWAPLTVHWGTPNGLLPDIMVSLLAAYPATGSMLDLWQQTA